MEKSLTISLKGVTFESGNDAEAHVSPRAREENVINPILLHSGQATRVRIYLLVFHPFYASI